MHNKDVAPNCWDLSVGEHLQQGESYKTGAVRGLFEELSISLDEAQKSNLIEIGSPQLFKFEDPLKNVKDYEFQQCFKLIYDGPYKIDGTEVAEAKFVSLENLNTDMASHPDKFTPWFINLMPLIK